MKIKIEKNIPLLPSGTGRRNRKYELSELKVMKVGDSFFIKGKKEGLAFANAFRIYLKREQLDWQIVQRNIQGGVRIYRIKNLQ
ncbi:MAG: hypothetical protein IID03_12055 [Candidatus Dadabacteria bacterium]|nr:hypothetical protein [Candidatus Dadabacteria bacterium]